MNIDQPLTLLGGLTPREFMSDYWQQRPLLIRQAIPDFQPHLSPADIRNLVKREEVESRMIWHDDNGWNMEEGPFERLPSARQPGGDPEGEPVRERDADGDAPDEVQHGEVLVARLGQGHERCKGADGDVERHGERFLTQLNPVLGFVGRRVTHRIPASMSRRAYRTALASATRRNHSALSLGVRSRVSKST